MEFVYLVAAIYMFSFGTAIARATLLIERQDFSNLTIAQIDVFTPYTWFAAAAFCQPSETLTWSCGGQYCPCDRAKRVFDLPR